MKNIFKKSIVICIILLLVGVSVSSAISVDTKSSNDDECRLCNKITDDYIVKVERLLNRVEIYSKLLLVLSRYNPELREISEELSNRISTLIELLEVSTNELSPFLCDVLEIIENVLVEFFRKIQDWDIDFFMMFMNLIGIPISIPLITVAYILQCDWVI